MINKLSEVGIAKGKVLLPKYNFDKWAVVACDQYTSEPEYWERVSEYVGEQSSTLNMILPEIYLEQEGVPQRQQKINQTMQEYLEGDVFADEYDGMIYVERQIGDGYRQGLIVCVDLERYEYTKGASSLIRSTEGTIEDRLPPRVEIRKKASLEMPHIMMLIDDVDNTMFSNIKDTIKEENVLYDFQLMEQGGHIKGYGVEEDTFDTIADDLLTLKNKNDGFLFAVGDGNHSLATAKNCWEDIKGELSEEEYKTHLARYALVEICNLHDETLVFESIHRLLLNVTEQDINKIAQHIGLGEDPLPYYRHGGQGMLLIDRGDKLCIAAVQKGIDVFMQENENVKIDYIHGDDVAYRLSNQDEAVSFIIPAFDKTALFATVMEDGSLPRKSFSMGHAHEKRYYLEARKIK